MARLHVHAALYLTLLAPISTTKQDVLSNMAIIFVIIDHSNVNRTITAVGMPMNLLLPPVCFST